MFNRIKALILYKPTIDNLLKEFIKNLIDHHIYIWQDTISRNIDYKNKLLDDQILRYIIAYSNAWFDDMTGCDYISNKIEDILHNTGAYTNDDFISISLSTEIYKDYIFHIFSKKDEQFEFLIRLILSNILSINKEQVDIFFVTEMALPITQTMEMCSLIVKLARKHKLIPEEMIARVPMSYR